LNNIAGFNCNTIYSCLWKYLRIQTW
jgi:hypothetical protein